MVYLVLANSSRPYSQGFWSAATVDATIVVYTIAYFAVCGFGRLRSQRHTQPPRHESSAVNLQQSRGETAPKGNS